MGRKRYRTKPAAIDRNVAIYGTRPPDLTPSAALGSFQGAEVTRDRGWIWIPTLSSKDEVDQWSRAELQMRAHVLFNSGGGFFHGACKGIARMVCGTGLMPYPTPPQVRGQEMITREWSRRVRQLYAQRCGSANTFNLERRFNVGQAQRASILNKIKSGDLFWVLARDADTGRLRVQLYEANQCGNGDTRGDASWTDGVKTDAHNAPVAYRFLGMNAAGKKTQTDVPVPHVLHLLEQERLHQVRGLCRPYPVLNSLFDAGEINAAITKGIKIREHIAYAVEQELPSAPGVPGGYGATNGGVSAAENTKFIEGNDGKLISLQEFLTGGEARYLKPGQKFKMIESNRPSEQVREHKYDIYRAAARTLGYSLEILWNIVELGGANMRFVQADTQAQVEIEQEDLVDQALGPHYIAWLRDMIEAGEIEDRPGWELHSWLAPARLTVDFGRDGKLHIEQYKRGHITMKTLSGYRGEEWTLEIDQYLDERQYIKEGIESRGLTWDEAFPEIGADAPEATPAPNPDDDEPPVKRP